MPVTCTNTLTAFDPDLPGLGYCSTSRGSTRRPVKRYRSYPAYRRRAPPPQCVAPEAQRLNIVAAGFCSRSGTGKLRSIRSDRCPPKTAEEIELEDIMAARLSAGRGPRGQRRGSDDPASARGHPAWQRTRRPALQEYDMGGMSAVNHW